MPVEVLDSAAAAYERTKSARSHGQLVSSVRLPVLSFNQHKPAEPLQLPLSNTHWRPRGGGGF